MVTDTVTSNVGIATGTALASWGEVYSLPIHTVWKGKKDDKYNQVNRYCLIIRLYMILVD